MAYNWDKDTDYAALMEKAAAAGDYASAANYEQQRNAKIQGLGLDMPTTSKYAGYIKPNAGTGVDFSTILRQQMDSGAGWQDVQKTYNDRLAKIAGDPSLAQYANDDIQREALDYILAGQSAALQPEEPSFDYEGWQTENPRPTWESPVGDAIGQLVEQILSRDPFSYDPLTDPMYQQYASQYLREGQRAMDNTMAEAASGAGGMNSYALAAAQQANNYYAAQLGDKLPELYQLAYQMYMNEGDEMRADLSMLQGIEDTDYGRFMDSESLWQSDRDFAYGMSRDENADYWQQKYWQEEEDDEVWEREQAELDRAEINRAEAWEKIQDMIALGMPIPDELYIAAGMDWLVGGADGEEAAPGGNYSGNGYSYTPTVEDASPEDVFNGKAEGSKAPDGYKGSAADALWDRGSEYQGVGSALSIDWNSVNDLGYGSISEERLAELEAAGKIESYQDGLLIKFRPVGNNDDFRKGLI